MLLSILHNTWKAQLDEYEAQILKPFRSQLAGTLETLLSKLGEFRSKLKELEA